MAHGLRWQESAGCDGISGFGISNVVFRKQCMVEQGEIFSRGAPPKMIPKVHAIDTVEVDVHSLEQCVDALWCEAVFVKMLLWCGGQVFWDDPG